jgi:hypothetical protein
MRPIGKKPESMTSQEWDNEQYGWAKHEQLPLFMSARDIREQYPVVGDLFEGDTPGPPDEKGLPTIESNYVGDTKDMKYRSGPSAFEDMTDWKRHGVGGIYNIGPINPFVSEERVTHPKTGKEHVPSYLTIDKSNPDGFVHGKYSSLAEDLDEEGMETPIHLDVANRMAAGYHRLQWAHDRDPDMLVSVMHGEQFARCLACEAGDDPMDHEEFRDTWPRGAPRTGRTSVGAHNEAIRTGRFPHDRMSPSKYGKEDLSTMHTKQHPLY